MPTVENSCVVDIYELLFCDAARRYNAASCASAAASSAAIPTGLVANINSAADVEMPRDTKRATTTEKAAAAIEALEAANAALEAASETLGTLARLFTVEIRLEVEKVVDPAVVEIRLGDTIYVLESP
jgi:hypothetical protein